jgi:hypothetical protein
MQNSDCGIPAAAAYSLNFAVVAPAGAGVGYVSAWPDDQQWPGTVVLNADQGGVVDNSAIVAAGADGGIQVMSRDNTDLVIDINGYFVDQMSLTYKGIWNSTASYVVGDVVSYAPGGATSSYVAVAANQNVEPSSDSTNGAAHWALLAQGGLQGTRRNGSDRSDWRDRFDGPHWRNGRYRRNGCYWRDWRDRPDRLYRRDRRDRRDRSDWGDRGDWHGPHRRDRCHWCNRRNRIHGHGWGEHVVVELQQQHDVDGSWRTSESGRRAAPFGFARFRYANYLYRWRA